MERHHQALKRDKPAIARQSAAKACDLSGGFAGRDEADPNAAVREADRLSTEPGMRIVYPPEGHRSCAPIDGRNVFQGGPAVNVTPFHEDHIMRPHKGRGCTPPRKAGAVFIAKLKIGRSGRHSSARSGKRELPQSVRHTPSKPPRSLRKDSGPHGSRPSPAARVADPARERRPNSGRRRRNG